MSRSIVLTFLGCLAAGAAGAHHAATGLYDRTAVGEIEGEIVSIFWRNPHVRLVIARAVDGGEPEQWEVEFGSVNTLERIGVSRDMIAEGASVSVAGRLGRNGLKALFADALTFADGRELALNASVERRYGVTEAALARARSADASERADIFRVWLPRNRPQTGRGGVEFPLTPAGRAAQAEWDPAADPALRCIPPGMPTVMDNPYPIEFRRQGDAILLLLEEWDGVRTIYMKGASGEPAQPRMGRSTGRWEGRTLVVETRDTDWRYIDDLGTPQSEDAVIVERFTLSADGTELDWEMRITDPVNFTEPVVIEGDWIWIPGHALKPFDCTLVEAGG
ncbi:MAG TPA: DUF6152 family protein [Gammaproteobacteria bacterium]|nr:DUF6152 family protein [Gammaproteobacteria bacterium]